jgi:hypothetical protein
MPLRLLMLVKLETVWPVFPVLDEACADRILSDAKPFPMKRLIPA